MADKQQPPASDKKPNIVARLWQKSGLNTFMILLGAKGALPATIALAAYRAPSFAEIYTTLGYLIAIIGTLSMCIQPRAKYIQSLITSLFAICSGSAMALLQIRCVIAARSAPSTGTQTGSSGAPEAPTFDASANATCAVFLLLWVFLANVVKSARPQLMLPMIQFSIFVIVTSVYSPQFPNMAAGMSFVRRLLITFLTGHAFACGVSLFVLPVTSRSMVTKQMGGLTKLLLGCLKAHGAYMATIHNSADFKGEASPEEKKAAAQLKGLLAKTNELMGKIKMELTFARQELAFGKLGPEHFTRIFKELRGVQLPINGMTTFLGIITSLREHKMAYADDPTSHEDLMAVKKLESEEWEEVIAISQEAYAQYQQALFGSLQHVALQLEFEKRPKPKASIDVETNPGPQPGDAGYSRHLEQALHKFQQHRIAVIQDWAKAKDLTLPKHFWRNVVDKPVLLKMQTSMARERINQHQLYMILYLNFLSMAVGRAVLRFSRYADELVDNGTMSKRRIIFPGWKRLQQLVSTALMPADTEAAISGENNGNGNIYLGDAFGKTHDPEHLPATNFYEKATNVIRKVPAMLRSRHAMFGYRAALATISIGIIGFLRQTRPFFLEQRGLWALIMVAISMDPYAGQGIFGFVFRTGGTIFAMVAAIAIWYACDHKAAAIIPVFWVYMSCWNIFMLKHMEYAMVAMISTITVILIIGYELQVDILGVKVVESNGQKFYPIALLAVYRLAGVCAGLFAAFVFTYFPFPITTHGALRSDVGRTLYILANYYSCVHTTLDTRLHLGPAINDLPPDHPIHKLDAARTKVFGKVLLMINRLHTHSSFTKYEPPFGGKFPRKAYADLIASIENIFAYLSLMEYSSVAYIRTSDELRLSRGPTEIDTNMSPSTSQEHNTLEKDESSQDSQAPTLSASHRSAVDTQAEEAWLASFRHFAASAYQRVTSHSVTSTLCLLSAAIKNAQPLPPYFKAPKPIAASSLESMMHRKGQKTKSEEEEEALLDIEHVNHPAFAAFAVGEVASAFVTVELGRVLRGIRQLVGEGMSFLFQLCLRLRC